MQFTPYQEQVHADGIISWVPENCTLSQNKHLPLPTQGPGLPHFLRDQASSKNGATCKDRIQHQQGNASGDRILLQETAPWLGNIIGNPNFPHYFTNTNIHILWWQLPQRIRRKLNFFWLPVTPLFSWKIKQSTLLHKNDNADGCLISINILEFITIIISYCTLLHVILTTSVTDDPYLVLLNTTHKLSELSWTTGACKKSSIGQLLAQFFCSLLINLPLDVNSQWISTIPNKITDNIPCAKKESININDSPPSFDYTTLKQKYLELIHCSFFRM